MLKTILLAASTSILFLSPAEELKEPTNTWLWTWLAVLAGLVAVEVLFSFVRSAIRVVHTLQILEFIWQCMAVSEIYLLHRTTQSSGVLLYGCTAIVGFFGVSTLALVAFLIRRQTS